MTNVKLYDFKEYLQTIENVFLFLNTIFWAVLAFVIGAAAFTLITGTIAGHGVSLFCITGYAGMIIGFFGGSYYLYRKE